MKQIIGIFLVLGLLVACAAASIALAFGWFSVRTSDMDTPPATLVFNAPPGEAQSGIATPTLAALEPVDPNAQPVVPAAGESAASGFNGTFSGTLSTDNGTAAPATLTLNQNGNAVTGQLDIGQGLTIDGGNCGAQAVPQLAQAASGAVDPNAPNHFQTFNTIPVAGLQIGVTLTADLAADGQTLAARADLDLPFICGRDPVISGNFTRQ